MGFQLSPLAEADIDEIAAYISGRNPRAATAWVAEIRRHIRALGETPGLGAPRAAIRPDLRIRPVGRYNILFRQDGPDAEIIRVVHGARRWERLVR